MLVVEGGMASACIARLDDGEGRRTVARRTDSACVSMVNWKRGQRSMAVPLI